MDVTVGAVLEGKVTGIMKFGAFVSLPGGKSGLVHISEIAYTYVNQVSDHLQVGQEVKVKVIGIDDAGRINLSIKKAMDPPLQQDRRRSAPPSAAKPAEKHSAPPTFEDKLKQFMQDSDSRMSGVRQYSENKKSRRSRKADYDDDYYN